MDTNPPLGSYLPLDPNPFTEKLATLRGVGPMFAPPLAEAVGGDRIADLLLHIPRGYVDRTRASAPDLNKPGEYAVWKGTVAGIKRAQRAKMPHIISLSCERKSRATILYFGRFFPPQIKIGAELLFGGKVADEGRMVNPEFCLPVDREASVQGISPLYSTPTTLPKSVLRRAIAGATSRIPSNIPEWQTPATLEDHSWPSFADALLALHQPAAIPADAPRDRLAYDELLAHQLWLLQRRHRERDAPGHIVRPTCVMREEAVRRWGYSLTDGQALALREIDADMWSGSRMTRMLHGDVGTGKTMVAILAMLGCAEAGFQAALMAPTEVLAKQHHALLQRISPIEVGFLSGNTADAQELETQVKLAGGSLKLVVGTHSLFGQRVHFHNLALAIVDEQHRFGVVQRSALTAKGTGTHLLMMSATPIPRSLVLTKWGDVDVSRLRERPGRRSDVITTIHQMIQFEALVAGIKRRIDAGASVYWICPLVNESEALALTAAEMRARGMRRVFGDDAVGLVHGAMPAAQRDAALQKFAAGDTRLLVATTVIEVGVDVPAATVVVIENAQHFGLAQLHQIRGRVGRGDEQSYCMLLTDLGDKYGMPWKRLKALRSTNDGFEIAEMDMKFRGYGDVLGVRQAGLPAWRVADFERDHELIEIASEDAVRLLRADPTLSSERGRAARYLLEIFFPPQAELTA
jgi:ATP-dependent DNA helicase RecG